MLKKLIVFALVCAMLICLAACGGGEKILHCDRCNAEVTVEADSNMEEGWIIFCEDCAKDVEQVEPGNP